MLPCEFGWNRPGVQCQEQATWLVDGENLCLERANNSHLSWPHVAYHIAKKLVSQLRGRGTWENALGTAAFCDKEVCSCLRSRLAERAPRVIPDGVKKPVFIDYSGFVPAIPGQASLAQCHALLQVTTALYTPLQEVHYVTLCADRTVL